jgi:hypothetical protein
MTPAGLQAYMASLQSADSGTFYTFPEKVQAPQPCISGSQLRANVVREGRPSLLRCRSQVRACWITSTRTTTRTATTTHKPVRDRLFASYLACGNALVLPTRKHLNRHRLRLGLSGLAVKRPSPCLERKASSFECSARLRPGSRRTSCRCNPPTRARLPHLPRNGSSQNLGISGSQLRSNVVRERRPSHLRCRRSQVRAGWMDYVNTYIYYHQDITNDPQTNKWWEEMSVCAPPPASSSVDASRAKLRGADGRAGNLHYARHWRTLPFRHSNPKYRLVPPLRWVFQSPPSAYAE